MKPDQIDSASTEEGYLLAQIAAIRREHERQLEPYYARLTRIASLSTGPVLLISSDEARSLVSAGMLREIGSGPEK
jgi:predicted amidohydrolase YtcJ